MNRLIGSKQAAQILGMSRTRLNALALEGTAPGLVRKEPGGIANLGYYLFDADVLERIAHERIAAIQSALEEALPPQLPIDGGSAAGDEMRAAS